MGKGSNQDDMFGGGDPMSVARPGEVKPLNPSDPASLMMDRDRAKAPVANPVDGFLAGLMQSFSKRQQGYDPMSVARPGEVR